MRHSRRAVEGYVQIDHRHSPGVTKAEIAAAGLDPSKFPDLREGVNYEAPTVSCTHCQRVIVLNPLRTRPRHNCPYCDHYVCDNAACVQMAEGLIPHRPLRQVMDELAESVVVAGNISEL